METTDYAGRNVANGLRLTRTAVRQCRRPRASARIEPTTRLASAIGQLSEPKYPRIMEPLMRFRLTEHAVEVLAESVNGIATAAPRPAQSCIDIDQL